LINRAPAINKTPFPTPRNFFIKIISKITYPKIKRSPRGSSNYAMAYNCITPRSNLIDPSTFTP